MHEDMSDDQEVQRIKDQIRVQLVTDARQEVASMIEATEKLRLGIYDSAEDLRGQREVDRVGLLNENLDALQLKNIQEAFRQFQLKKKRASALEQGKQVD